MTDEDHAGYLRRTISKLVRRQEEETNPEVLGAIRLLLSEYRGRLRAEERACLICNAPGVIIVGGERFCEDHA